jgi:site-specific DNA-methyltransferase (adenine-specific)
MTTETNRLMNQLVHGDCLNILPTLNRGSVNFVLTDPPYLANYKARDGRTVPNDNNDAWLKPAFAEIFRVLARDSYAVSFYGWPQADRFISAWRAAGFRIAGHLVFPKSYASNSGHVAYCHECAYLLAKGSPRPQQGIPDVLPWKYTGNRFHPTEKPLAALTPLIKSFSAPGDWVLDPFAGSGSSLLAARQLGRNYVGIEMDAGYFAKASARLGS